jgi:hypothetical protein
MSYKEYNQAQDISTQLSVINEVIPITGSLFSSSANVYGKTYINITSGSAVSGGFWETIYDGSPTSISSSALCDLTFGCSSASLLVGYAETFMKNEKQRTYKEMARLCLGSSKSLFSFNSVVYHDLFFMLFKRRIFKDEIKKGNVSINLQVSGGATPNNDILSLTDTGASSRFEVGPAGDEAALYSGSTQIGKVYYNAGVVAFATGVFYAQVSAKDMFWSGTSNFGQVAVTGNLDKIVDGFRNRINQVQFLNQTNLHSTIYFCRALNSEFNYSTNPTFVDNDGRIVVTSGSDNQTRTYITRIGMYDINDNLLAVSSTSEPVKKSPDNELIFRCKLSY